MERKHVVIIGGGFGGLAAAKKLKKADVDVTLIDKSNHHLFQPLLYQVATGSLGPAEIAVPLRHLLRNQKNCTVLLNEVSDMNLAKQQVTCTDGQAINYDELIVAAGSKYNYFGKNEWEADAPSLKSIEDALEIRARVMNTFEEAELYPERAAELMTFVIVGAGPTGVELAGQIAELARHGLKNNYRRIDPTKARVVLVDAAPKALGMFGDKLADKAQKQLEELGVEMILSARVENVGEGEITLNGDVLKAGTVIWAAGVAATSLATKLNAAAGLEAGPGGRIKTNEYCQLPGFDNVYAVGDMAAALDENGKPLPGLATVAMQQGRYVAKHITGQDTRQFYYTDKGSMATIGRHRAIAMVGNVRISGIVAWLLWLLIHLRYVAGLQNRVIVLVRWAWSYLTFGRAARLITRSGWKGPKVDAKEASPEKVLAE